MEQLLTPVHLAYKKYRECHLIKDPYIRYRFLENTVASFIKLHSTASLLIAKDFSSQLYSKAALEVFSGSSLGGWVNALNCVTTKAKEFPLKQSDYFKTYYLPASQESNQDAIGAVQNHLNQILNKFEEKGYKCDSLKTSNFLAIFEKIVLIRNKLAHGALDIEFLNNIEIHYSKAVKLLLALLPLSDFELYGKEGGYVKHFRGDSEFLEHEGHDCSIWFESALLKHGFASPLPFLNFNQDSQDIFFLNDSVEDSEREVEYILYKNGQIMYKQAHFDWANAAQDKYSASIPFHTYKQHKDFLLTVANNWKRIGIKLSALNSIDDGTPCVYVFQVPLKVLGNSNRHILYVGKTQELQTRLKSYIKTQKGYDDSRPEIIRMFHTYGSDIELWYRKCSTKQEVAKIEKAVYQSYRPEFNLISPPNN